MFSLYWWCLIDSYNMEICRKSLNLNVRDFESCGLQSPIALAEFSMFILILKIQTKHTLEA